MKAGLDRSIARGGYTLIAARYTRRLEEGEREGKGVKGEGGMRTVDQGRHRGRGSRRRGRESGRRWILFSPG